MKDTIFQLDHAIQFFYKKFLLRGSILQTLYLAERSLTFWLSDSILISNEEKFMKDLSEELEARTEALISELKSNKFEEDILQHSYS